MACCRVLGLLLCMVFLLWLLLLLGRVGLPVLRVARCVACLLPLRRVGLCLLLVPCFVPRH